MMVKDQQDQEQGYGSGAVRAAGVLAVLCSAGLLVSGVGMANTLGNSDPVVVASPSPSPTATRTPEPVKTPTPTLTPTPTPSVSKTPTPTPSASKTPEPSAAPTTTNPPARQTPVTPGERHPGANPELHIVMRGEKLTMLARYYGVTVDELVAANGISNRDLILTGQVLRIPPKKG